MKNFPSALKPARAGWLAVTVLVLVLGGLLSEPTGFSQAPGTMTSNEVLTPLLTKLKAQQDQLAANQSKIEAQTAQLKEEIRLSKIYASRSR